MDVALLLTCHNVMLFDCYKGGLVTQCHNEVRDAVGDLAALAFKDVICEPIVCKGNDTVPALIAHLGIRGVGGPSD